MNQAFGNAHENRQFLALLESLRQRFETDSSSFCLCLANVPLQNAAGTARSQFDTILLTSSNIVVLELKDMSGTLTGSLVDRNSVLVMEHPGGKSSSLPAEQVFLQHNYLQTYFALEFQPQRQKPSKSKLRVDLIMAFSGPVQFQATIPNDQARKWLSFGSVQNLDSALNMLSKHGDFDLSLEEARQVASGKFGLVEVTPDSFVMRRESAAEHLEKALDYLLVRATQTETLRLLEKHLGDYLSDQEIQELRSVRMQIHSAAADGKIDRELRERFRSLLSHVQAAEIPADLINAHFARLLLGRIQAYATRVTEAFKQVNSRDKEKSGDIVSDLIDENNRIVGILGRYQSVLQTQEMLSKTDVAEDFRNKVVALTLLELLD